MRAMLLAALCLCIGGSLASAGEPARGVAEEALARLGPCPSRREVRAVLHLPDIREGREGALSAVAILEGAGCAGVVGLHDLADHSVPEVRAAALRGVARARLRVREGRDRLVAALADREAQVRAAACAALGAVGEAADIPRLIEMIGSEVESDRHGAHQALCDLTGLRLPPQVAAWSYWWADASGALPARLRAAAETLSGRSSPEDADDARQLLAASGWADLDQVQATARVLLASAEPKRRLEGYRLVIATRAGDMAPELESALNRESDRDGLLVAVEAAFALGLRAEKAVAHLSQPEDRARGEGAPAGRAMGPARPTHPEED